MLLLGPLWIVAVVIGIAGAWKLAQPRGTRQAMAALGWRVPALAVRGIGAGEVVLAIAVVVAGGAALAWVTGGLYLAFAVIAQRLRGREVSCGCFGSASARSSRWHVGMNVACALVAAAAAIVGPPAALDAWERLPVGGVAHVILVGAGAAAVVALLTVLPAATEAMRAPGRSVPVTFRVVDRGEPR